MLMIPTFQF
uniref:Uncharacterized protein n=1 Tax=Arundo donax TaxID=35708 RepID=A0A0A8ZB83_ARUDO